MNGKGQFIGSISVVIKFLLDGTDLCAQLFRLIYPPYRHNSFHVTLVHQVLSALPLYFIPPYAVT